MSRTKLEVTDYSFNLNAEGKYKLAIQGFGKLNENGTRSLEAHEIDLSDLTIEQLGVIGGLFDAIFDKLELNDIVAARIAKLDEEE